MNEILFFLAGGLIAALSGFFFFSLKVKHLTLSDEEKYQIDRIIWRLDSFENLLIDGLSDHAYNIDRLANKKKIHTLFGLQPHDFEEGVVKKERREKAKEAYKKRKKK